MSEEKNAIERLAEELRRQRDELRVKIHLAEADARDEWDELERKWEQMKPKFEAAKSEAKKVSQNVASALELAGEEIKEGYKRIRQRLG